MLGKRFVFATVACVCLTVTTIMLKYGAKDYTTGLGIIVGLFTLAQSYTDLRNGKTHLNPPEK